MLPLISIRRGGKSGVSVTWRQRGGEPKFFRLIGQKLQFGGDTVRDFNPNGFALVDTSHCLVSGDSLHGLFIKCLAGKPDCFL